MCHDQSHCPDVIPKTTVIYIDTYLPVYLCLPTLPLHSIVTLAVPMTVNLNLLITCGDIETNPGPETSYRRITMCHANIQSIGSGDQGIASPANVKMDEMRSTLVTEHKFDVICLNETWLNDNVTYEDIRLDNYVVHRRDRGSLGGGVCTYINNYLPCRRRSDLEPPGIEMMWVELQLVPRYVLIAVCYRPPGMNRDQCTTFIDELQESITKVIDSNPDSIYILGDFNDPCSEWESIHSHSELKQDLLHTASSLGLYQLITEPTHCTSHSANILDLIFTDSPGYITSHGNHT